MRVPASSDSNSNLVIGYNEPTSVLDLRRSPSPTNVIHQTVDENGLCSHHHVMHSIDWDSIMKELELDDETTPTLKSNLPLNTIFSIDPPPNTNNNDYVSDLIRVADCIDSDELQLAQVILSRLNHCLRSPVGRPLQRAAFYFKEALESVLITGSNRNQIRLSTWTEIVQRIKAIKEYSGLSPIPFFSHFTANQTILDSQSSSMFLHVIDFEIGFGGQYASLMREIDFFRITAVVSEYSAVETRLVKENLTQFAADLRIRFQIEFVSMTSFEMLSFKSIRFVDGERIVVLLSPATIRRISGFVEELRRVSSNVVVFVYCEGWNGISGGFEYYTTVLESLDGVVGGDLVKKKMIETFVLRDKIAFAVETVSKRGGEMMTWREAFCAAGMRLVPLSHFVDFQAECIVEKVQVSGFHVAKRHGELVLCWREKPLVATSAWRF